LASRNASFHERGIAGALLAPLKWFCISLLLLLGLILAAWTIDWIFVSRVWPEGLARLQSILTQDLARTSHIECWCDDLPKRAARTANFLYASLFQVTGIHDMGARFADGAALSIPDTIVRNTYIVNFEAIQVAMVGTQLFGVRLATLAMAIPLYALVYCAALTDGLAQRAIRRASSGRESASLYHRAKRLQVVFLVTSGAVSLLLPESIEPRWVWVPCLAVLGILARIQWTYYKKHL
jgi:integrating conjugative element membrane protein (TIGR03747 family)